MTNNPDTQLLDSVLVSKVRWERLCQSHEALLAACKELMATQGCKHTNSARVCWNCQRARLHARAALKLAEEA